MNQDEDFVTFHESEADPALIKELLVQCRKEISRLQKLRAKEIIAHMSEKELLLAKIAELQKNPHTIVIERDK